MQHMRVLPHAEVAAAVETVRTSDSAAPAVTLAFEFLVLTAGRSAEVRLATWDEMGTWPGVDDIGGADEGVWSAAARRRSAACTPRPH